jgi:cyclic dehypoxanthinyl futalosine synthase
MCFVPLAFDPSRTELSHLPVSTGCANLREIAIAWLLLDKMPNIQPSWLTQGPKIGQLALQYGVNDMGSTVIEEKVVTAKRAVFMVPLSEIERLIRDAGPGLAGRNSKYEILTA